MRRMRRLQARRGRAHPHQHTALLHFHLVTRHGVRFGTGLADSPEAMELPMVPRADHVIAVQPALASGPPT